jgi:hypothetical protein
MLAEFGLALRIEAVGPGRVLAWTLAELLPDAFTSHRLEAS